MTVSKGGQNQTHATLERHQRLDSFLFSWEAGTDILIGGCDKPVALTYLPNNYGGVRAFFLCPDCGRRVRFLYRRWGRFSCRHCARLNYRSQQDTHDEMEPYRKAAKLLRTKFNLSEDDIPVPIDLPYYMPLKPKGMRWATYSALCAQLRRLAQEYQEAFIRAASRICGLLI